MKPAYIIIGVQRSGTTTLHNAICQHPDLPAPRWPLYEAHFFDYTHRWNRGREWYEQDLDGAGDKTPTLLDHPLAPARVASLYPDVPIIAVLRNPVERAFSHWQKATTKGFEQLSFREALEAEAERAARLNGNFSWYDDYYLSHFHLTAYLRRGRYADHLPLWLDRFPNLMLFRAEDVWRDLQSAVEAVWAELGLPTTHKVQVVRYQRLGDEQFPPDTRRWLEQYYVPHNERLAALLGDDRWLWRDA